MGWGQVRIRLGLVLAVATGCTDSGGSRAPAPNPVAPAPAALAPIPVVNLNLTASPSPTPRPTPTPVPNATAAPSSARPAPSSAAPAPDNRAPGVVVTSPDPVTGLYRVTRFRFTASGSDPDGDPLTFTWTFGDGTTDTGATVRHVFPRAAIFNVTVTASDGRGGSAVATQALTVGSLTGRWWGIITNGGLRLGGNLTQEGTQISSDMGTSMGPGNLSGSLSDPLNVTITVPKLCESNPLTFRGTLNASLNYIDVQSDGCGVLYGRLELNR